MTSISRLRSRAALTLLAAAVLAAPLASTPLTAPTDAYACEQAKIAGQSKCIAAGQFCKKAAEKDYRKYGYTCSKKDRNGRWHLQNR